MRDIKFRGKRLDNGEWVFGSLIISSLMYGNKYEIRVLADYEDEEDKTYQVHPSTIGQYIGRKDKNGVEIYERDVLKFPNNDFWTGAKVEWFDAELMLVKGDGCIELNHNDGMYTDRDSAEVIGNIYENPELLEG